MSCSGQWEALSHKSNTTVCEGLLGPPGKPFPTVLGAGTSHGGWGGLWAILCYMDMALSNMDSHKETIPAFLSLFPAFGAGGGEGLGSVPGHPAVRLGPAECSVCPAQSRPRSGFRLATASSWNLITLFSVCLSLWLLSISSK